MKFQLTAPETAGIPSEAVERFLDRLKKKQVNMHGFCLIRDERLVAEGYWKPYDENTLHRMFSAGKSFTAIAVGLLEAEGKLALSDRICSFFPDMLPPEGPHPYTEMMTVRDLLTMRSAHRSTTYRGMKANWVQSFFRVTPTNVPGTVFSYDTSSTQVLSALVERLSGLSLLDYLKARLPELELSADSMFITDPEGISQGGSGLRCTLRDMAKLAHVMLKGGYWEGKELIPPAFVAEATAKHAETPLQSVIDEQQGYGYFIWRTRNNGFTFYGMGGQLALCIPDKKLLLATMADTMGSPGGLPLIYDAFYEEIYERCSDAALPDNDAQARRLRERLASLEIPAVAGGGSALEAGVYGVRYVLDENPFGLSAFRLSRGLAELETPDGIKRIEFGRDRPHVYTDAEGVTCVCSANWLSEDTFLIRLDYLNEELSIFQASFVFKGGMVSLALKKTGGNAHLDIYNGVVSGRGA